MSRSQSFAVERLRMERSMSWSEWNTSEWRMTRRSALGVLLGSAAIPPAALWSQKKDVEKLAPYYPTPEFVVEKMLRLGALKPGEKMFDLGSGDGRIVIMAAQ